MKNKVYSHPNLHSLFSIHRKTLKVTDGMKHCCKMYSCLMFHCKFDNICYIISIVSSHPMLPNNSLSCTVCRLSRCCTNSRKSKLNYTGCKCSCLLPHRSNFVCIDIVGRSVLYFEKSNTMNIGRKIIDKFGKLHNNLNTVYIRSPT